MAEIKVNEVNIIDPNSVSSIRKRQKTEEKPEKKKVKKKGGWFQKIPTNVLFSPAGMVLAMLALAIEVIDWIPIPVIDQIFELPLEIILIVLMIALIPDISLKSLAIPFLIERIPIINDIVPTWFIKFIA